MAKRISQLDLDGAPDLSAEIETERAAASFRSPLSDYSPLWLVSIAQQTALNLKANLASPAFTGTPSAPTAAVNTNTTQLSTTAFVDEWHRKLQFTKTNIDYTLALGDEHGVILMSSSAPHTLTIPTNATAALPIGSMIPIVRHGTGAVTVAVEVGLTLECGAGEETLVQHRVTWLWKRSNTVWKITNHLNLANNTSDADKPVSTAQQTALNLKANIASPAFTGVPTAPTAAPGTNTTQLSTTAFVAAMKAALVKGDVGLGNVDNTSDANKPVSTAQQTALDLKANIASPAFTGVPTAPTAAPGTNTTQLSTTAFVAAMKAALVKGDVGLGNVDNTSDAAKPVSTAQQTALDLKANIASPAFTGVPTAPTAAPGTNTTQLSTTAFVAAMKAALVKGDVGLGNVDNTSDVAKPVSTATQTALNLKANLASPAFTGTPTAPTPSIDTNTTQLATAALVYNWNHKEILHKGSTDYTLAAGDETGLILMNSASPQTLTVLDNATVPFPFGTLIPVVAHSTGVITIAGAAGVIVTTEVGGLTLVQNRVVWLWKQDTDVWKLFNTLNLANNTSDANKPVSTATQTALNLKANLASPAFTGVPTAPTAAAGTSTTQLATTAFATIANNLKADIASPAFTGAPTAPTPAAGNDSTRIATTAFIQTQFEGLGPIVGEQTETGNITLALADANAARRWSNVSATINVPNNTAVAFPRGTVIILAAENANAIRGLTVSANAGVTIRGKLNINTSATAPDAAALLIKVNTNTWYIIQNAT